MVMKFFLPDIRVPASYDFDKNKTPIALLRWGNDKWGDCVIAGEANHLLRLERIEQRRTVRMTDDTAVERYKALTGAQVPGDDKDEGLVVLDAMRDWRNSGWTINNRNYTIAAYGELKPGDRQQLRMASYTLHGVHLGFSLPISTQKMGSVWDYTGQSGSEWRPGSWGGHLVFSKRFTADGLEILTWGEKVFVTNEFIEKYCDEAWAVVDSFDSWRIKQTIDVNKLIQQISEISSHPINQ
jgi:hypothetical protein